MRWEVRTMQFGGADYALRKIGENGTKEGGVVDSTIENETWAYQSCTAYP